MLSGVALDEHTVGKSAHEYVCTVHNNCVRGLHRICWYGKVVGFLDPHQLV